MDTGYSLKNGMKLGKESACLTLCELHTSFGETTSDYIFCDMVTKSCGKLSIDLSSGVLRFLKCKLLRSFVTVSINVYVQLKIEL